MRIESLSGMVIFGPRLAFLPASTLHWLCEDDHGAVVARRTAQQLVVHQRRPGGQLQFSAFVDLGGRTARFVALIDWMRAPLAEPLTVERLAGRAAMGPRNFPRAFAAEIGITPAKAVERLRLETARAAVETSHTPLKRIAEAVGFWRRWPDAPRLPAHHWAAAAGAATGGSGNPMPLTQRGGYCGPSLVCLAADKRSPTPLGVGLPRRVM
jgi:AraC-like DNA-binding protein